jgi:hypothetical protein
MAFPSDLDNQSAGDIIEAADRNAIVAKIGIDSSSVVTSLDYLIKNTSSKLGKIASLSDSDSNLIVGSGSGWVAESGATLRTSLGLGASDDVEFDLITTSVNSSSNAITATQAGAGSALKLTSTTSTAANAVFNIVNNSTDMCSKAQLISIAPTLTGAATEYWTNTNIYSKTTGTGTNKNSGWMRGLDIGTFAGGSSSSDGQDLADLTSIITAYGIYDGVGTVDNAFGLYINPYNTPAAATIGNMYDIYLGDGTLTSGSGTLTGTHWGVYQKRTDSPNFFGGEVRCGTTSDLGSYKIQTDGNIVCVALTETSDAQYKENIRDITDGLEVVKKLRPRQFTWKQDEDMDFDEGNKTGFVAQEVQEALEGTDYESGIVSHGKTLGLNYGKIIPLLTNAIQEQQRQIDDLKKKISN